ncbi:MAG TPA: GspE/PulE family protein [Candidatus Bathyarchaeia archaeon]|nr:GspE/PulE family protein [Candidatus Bathyarchaeia archaeon]
MSSQNHPHQRTVVERVDDLIATAIVHGASDIHLEPYADFMRVRFRIDGMLVMQPSFAHDIAEQIVARIKILARMNVTIKRVAQDGKFFVAAGDEKVDIRVATFPTVYGEKVVIRILDRTVHVLSLDQLGMHEHIQANILTHVQRMHGLLLVTGPTGSGKTTTLYALLNYLNMPDRHIITLEDPVEYYLDGIVQSQVHTSAGFTFENGMRSLLRQDPDVIMVGEIRDKQTARIAIEAALTGHLVVSTLHTHDAPSAVARLADMGIEPFLINAALIGVVAQRLARRLCDACKITHALSLQEQELLESWGHTVAAAYNSAGCDNCDGAGTKGRVGIFQWLSMNEQLRSCIHKNFSLDTLYSSAYQQGMLNLRDDAAVKVKEGIISFAHMLSLIV